MREFRLGDSASMTPATGAKLIALFTAVALGIALLVEAYVWMVTR